MNELTIDGKIYISSKRAAEITGYAKDYIGQLCREGHVEARMVGRSWYVLESSIRAHRFGGDAQAEPLQEASAPVETTVSPVDAWEKPTYVPEIVPTMAIPAVQRVAEPQEHDISDPTAETLTDMQAAWKEWFSQKQDTMIETPEIIDAREEEGNEADLEEKIEAFKAAHQVPAEPVQEEETVLIQPIQAPAQPAYEEIEAEAEPVYIHHAPEVQRVEREEAAVPTKRERKQAQAKARKERRARKRNSNGGSMIARAALIAVILFVLVITAIGTGYAERFTMKNAILTPIFDFLGGTSTYSK